MDYLGGAASTLARAPAAASGGSLEHLLGVVVALAVLRLEVMRRAAELPSNNTSGLTIHKCKIFLRQHAAETLGLIACLTLAAGLRMYGSGFGQSVVNEEVWENIMREWPILLTADSLLALQAMLRTLVFASVALRAAPNPLSQETAFLFLNAAMARALLASQSKDYSLDGPLGGSLPVVFEFISVVPLALLSRRIGKQGFLLGVSTFAVAACLARRNRLSLAQDTFIDGLFMFAHINELFAAFSFLSRSLVMDIEAAEKHGVAGGFAHVILLMQQSLAAYYFVQAFSFSDSLVSAGHPFEILQIGGVAQLGAYAAAAILHVVECVEAPQMEMLQSSETDDAE